MKRIILLSAAFATATCAAAAPEAPAQIVVVVGAHQCAAKVEPGAVDLKAVFPQARMVYKDASSGGKPGARSCEIDVDRGEFLSKFPFCALASMKAAGCWISFAYAGGRDIELSATTHAVPDAEACGFVCPGR